MRRMRSALWWRETVTVAAPWWAAFLIAAGTGRTAQRGAGDMADGTATICCLWCDGAFQPHRGGSEQRFCSSSCRTAFHGACRTWAVQAVLDGRLSLKSVRKASLGSVHAPSRGIRPVLPPQVAPTASRPLERLGSVNAGSKMHRLAGVKMHQAR
jgi:hypothetical protein